MNAYNRKIFTASLILLILILSFSTCWYRNRTEKMFQANLTLEDQVDSLVTCNARAQTKIASYLDQNHQLQAMLETERSQHQNTITTLNRQIEETRKQLQNLREKLAANPNDIEVRRQYQELQHQLATEEQRRTTLQEWQSWRREHHQRKPKRGNGLHRAATGNPKDAEAYQNHIVPRKEARRRRRRRRRGRRLTLNLCFSPPSSPMLMKPIRWVFVDLHVTKSYISSL